MSAVTLKDIAKKLAISEATVSLALSNHPGVSSKTKERVLQCAKEMDYIPNPIARGLATKRTMTIGCVCPDPENPCYGKLIKRISYYCSSWGYSLILSVSGDDPVREGEVVKQLINCCVDGIIVMPLNIRRNDHPAFESLYNIPHVFAISYYEGFEDECILTDYATGSYQLTRSLLASGHRSIWYLVTKDTELPVSKLRLDGWRRAYEERGLECSPDWIIPCDYADSGFAYYITKRILGDRRRPDAICTLNDYLATGVRQAIVDSGYRIPDEISLAGYDDALGGFFMDTPLTTVRQDIDTIAKECLRYLMKRINPGLVLEEPIEQVIPPELIIRKTTRM